MSTKKIAQNTAVQIVGKIISTGLGLVSIALLTRFLGTEQFGWYVTAISFLQFVGIVIDFGLIPVTAQMMSEPKFDKEKLLQNLLGFRFFSALIFLGITPLIALLFPYPIEVKQTIALLTVSFLAIAMSQVYMGYNQTKLTMHIQAIGEVVGRLVLIAALYFVIFSNLSFIYAMIAVGLGSISHFLVLHLTTKSRTSVALSYDREIWIAILKKSWPIAISIIFNVLYLRGDVILLSIMSTQHEVGLYGAAYRVLDIVGQTAMLMMGVILPILAFSWSRGDRETFTRRFQQSFDMMMILAIPMTLGLILLAGPIMDFVAGNDFIGSAKALQILALAILGVYLGSVFGHAAVAIDKQKQTMWIYISNAFISLVLYLYLIPRFGMIGAAWTTVFSEAYAGLLLFLVVNKFIKHRFSYITVLKTIFSSLIMALVIVSMSQIHVLLTILAGGLAYGIMIIATKAVSLATVKEVFKIKS